MKKGDTRVVGWSPPSSMWGDWGYPNIPTPNTAEAAGSTPSPSPHSPHRHPHLNYIDEDALEGLYFDDRRILRCLPYFLRKTRPRASYGLLEAFSPSLTADRVSVG